MEWLWPKVALAQNMIGKRSVQSTVLFLLSLTPVVD